MFQQRQKRQLYDITTAHSGIRPIVNNQSQYIPTVRKHDIQTPQQQGQQSTQTQRQNTAEQIMSTVPGKRPIYHAVIESIQQKVQEQTQIKKPIPIQTTHTQEPQPITQPETSQNTTNKEAAKPITYDADIRKTLDEIMGQLSEYASKSNEVTDQTYLQAVFTQALMVDPKQISNQQLGELVDAIKALQKTGYIKEETLPTFISNILEEWETPDIIGVKWMDKILSYTPISWWYRRASPTEQWAVVAAIVIVVCVFCIVSISTIIAWTVKLISRLIWVFLVEIGQKVANGAYAVYSFFYQAIAGVAPGERMPMGDPLMNPLLGGDDFERFERRPGASNPAQRQPNGSGAPNKDPLLKMTEQEMADRLAALEDKKQKEKKEKLKNFGIKATAAAASLFGGPAGDASQKVATTTSALQTGQKVGLVITAIDKAAQMTHEITVEDRQALTLDGITKILSTIKNPTETILKFKTQTGRSIIGKGEQIRRQARLNSVQDNMLRILNANTELTLHVLDLGFDVVMDFCRFLLNPNDPQLEETHRINQFRGYLDQYTRSMSN